MPRRRSSARCSSRLGGFTLSEVLVGLSIASLVILGVGTGFVFVTKAWGEHQARAQAQQALRAAVEAITREMRLTAACMPLATAPPVAPNFQPLTGANSSPDSITITANPLCAGPTSITTDCNACTTIAVDNTTNFQGGMWAYIYNSDTGTNPPGPYGEFFLVQSVAAGNPGALTVNPSTPLLKFYPRLNTTADQLASAVYGADQRTFAVSSTCTGCNGVPTLTLQTLGGVAAQPLVKGIDQLTIRYVLNRTYTAGQCNSQTGGTLSLCVVNLPTQSPSIAGDWQQVRAVTFSLDAQSRTPVRASASGDGLFHLSQTFTISPRNFVFQTAPRVNWTPY